MVAVDIGPPQLRIDLERDGAPVDLGHALDDALGVVGRHLDEREALEDADVADRLAVAGRRAVMAAIRSAASRPSWRPALAISFA